MTLQAIKSGKLPHPVGPYSPALMTDGYLYLSGQVGQDPSTGELVAGGVAEEAKQIFENIAVLLEASGRNFADVVRVGVFLTDIRSFGTVNAEYATHFVEPFPARTTIGVAALPLGASVEIDMVVQS